MRLRRAIGCFLAFILAGAGCSDDPAGPVGSLPDLESLRTRLPQGIHPVLVFSGGDGGSADLTARLRFVRVDESRDVQAFQGSVEVDPKVAAVQSARVVGPATAAARVDGSTIHFAGAIPGGLAEEAFLELTLRTGTGIRLGHITMTLVELVGGSSPASFTDLVGTVPDGTVHLVREGS